MIDSSLQRYGLLALAAAALFGVSAPLAKLLVANMHPVLLAGLLYLGSGLGLLAVFLSRSRVATEASLSRSDMPWLAGAVLCGGMIAPVAMVWGLSGIGAAAGSLLLSSEGVITTLLAAVLFREAVGLRIAAAAAVLGGAGLLLTWDPKAASLSGVLSPHALAIVGACALWGLDNNLTRRISAADPVAIAMVKGLAAGAVNCGLALTIGAGTPGLAQVAGSMALGAVSYGLSLVLFILALRHLGSARTGAHFSTAPFFGALFAVMVLGEPVTAILILAVALTMVATWLVLSEDHGHAHVHAHLEHSHRHVHDAHHRHTHDGSEGPEPHAHGHVHEPMAHTHAHLPDLHHRHDH